MAAAERSPWEIIVFCLFFGSVLFTGIVLFRGLFSEENLESGPMPASAFLIIAGTHIWLLFWALFFTRIFKNSFSQIGLIRKGWVFEIAAGLLSGIALYFILSGIQTLLAGSFSSPFLNNEDSLIGSGGLSVALALMISVTAGVGEEVLYRGYAHMVLVKYTGSRLFTIIFLSAAFAVTHLYQGIPGVIVTALFAAAMHGLFYFRFTLIAAITAHILYDILATLTPSVW